MKPDYEFLIIIGFAVLVKQVLSPFHSLWRATSTALAAVLCAYVFTDPLVGLLGWEDEKTRLAVAAVLGLTGEHIIRHIIDTGQDPHRGLGRTKDFVSKAVEIYTIWRAGTAPAKPDTPSPAKPDSDAEGKE